MWRPVLALILASAALWTIAARSVDLRPDPVQSALAFARAHDLIAASAELSARWTERDKLWRVSVDFPIFASDPEGGNFFSLLSACVGRDGRVWEGILPSRAWLAGIDESASVVTSSVLACEVARAHLTARGFILPPPVVSTAPLSPGTLVTIIQYGASSTAEMHLLEVSPLGEVRRLRTESLLTLKME